ncbi:hypothetical protein Spiaf_1417 [Spirochaeta africana DSM 8902]|uniref:Uncharacterized protein n=2 Tax=Spirochaeta TaxID=146 RepID=H9UIY7_SPIAZ|nr:hypothetical protein Spiaf_1417 [Spirochaeta africana DSM 8902]
MQLASESGFEYSLYMEATRAQFPLGNRLPEIESLLPEAGTGAGADSSFKSIFTQNEEFCLLLPESDSLDFPSLPLHHDIQRNLPDAGLRQPLVTAIENISQIAPSLLHGLQYFFSPAEPLIASFYRITWHAGRAWLYLLRIDLAFRPNEHQPTAEGSNDRYPSYRSNRIYLEADLLPLSEPPAGGAGAGGAASTAPAGTTGTAASAIRVDQAIDDTWIGETGRGYFQQGIWMDRDLTRFFSKLFLPAGRRMYPFYPVTCRYRTVAHTILNPLQPERLGTATSFAAAALDFLQPHIPAIQEQLRGSEFSEKLPLFEELRQQVPQEWIDFWKHVSITPYLNDRDQKEFLVGS